MIHSTKYSYILNLQNQSSYFIIENIADYDLSIFYIDNFYINILKNNIEKNQDI